MANVMTPAKTFWACLVGGMLTGMGNGSVFGAAMMCALGRGRFENWGGWGADSYNIVTFNGFMTWQMIVFGIAFMAIMLIALSRHGELEANS